MNTLTSQTGPMYLDVTYFPGSTVYGSVNARLEWTVNNHITLTTVEGTSEAPQYKQLFDVSLAEITSVRFTLDVVRFKTMQGTFRVSVAQYAGPAVATGGVAGIAVAYSLQKRSGVSTWEQRLKASGVRVIRFGFLKLFGITFGVVVLVIGAIIGVYMALEK